MSLGQAAAALQFCGTDPSISNNMKKRNGFLLVLTAFFITANAQQKQHPKQMKQALIIIDVQKDYFKGGRMELSGAREAADNAGRVLDHFRAKKLPVIHVQHIAADPAAGFFLPGTAGIEIDERVKPAAGEKLITKHYPNSFRETDLLNYLRSNNIKELVITGMMTHVCVDATVKAAKDYGIDCIVIADATATKDLEVQGKQITAADVQTALLGAMAFYYSEVKSTRMFLNP